MIAPWLSADSQAAMPNKEGGENAEQQAENNSEGARAHDHTETAEHVARRHCRHPGNERINNVNVAQTQSA